MLEYPILSSPTILLCYRMQAGDDPKEGCGVGGWEGEGGGGVAGFEVWYIVHFRTTSIYQGCSKR